MIEFVLLKLKAFFICSENLFLNFLNFVSCNFAKKFLFFQKETEKGRSPTSWKSNNLRFDSSLRHDEGGVETRCF